MNLLLEIIGILLVLALMIVAISELVLWRYFSYKSEFLKNFKSTKE